MDGFKIDYDLGVDGANVTGLFAFDDLTGKSTWELPNVSPTPEGGRENVSDARVTINVGEFGGASSVSVDIYNAGDKPLWLNGFAFDLSFGGVDGTRFSFPANVPHGTFDIGLLKDCQPVCAGLVNFAVAVAAPSFAFNALFIDETEKWATGVWRRGDVAHITFMPALEADLKPGETITVGTLYIQRVNAAQQLPTIRGFVEKLGFRAPVATFPNANGAMYSCHPHGTMDGNFTSLNEDLRQFARRLPALADMGVKHLWLLPVFDHDDKGVYHSNDQDVIDERYGGEDAMRHYAERARELGMGLMFDYVPHGPVPSHALAADNPDWLSKRRDGTPQIEWDCVSMDYNNEGYQHYTTALVRGHVRRFGIVGARIDCAMGGLSNWRPCAGERPSGNSVKAGVSISKAIREGFPLEGVKTPLNMPENFNPIPPYYPYTDVFYGFNLYRVFCELEPLFNGDKAAYCAALTEWLKAEREVTPANLVKLRFLGNHDTVSWVWQAKRAADIYGVNGAKALWAVISLIDGLPMIYQGDEDPKLRGKDGENLTGFFTELFKVRAAIPADADTEYFETGLPVMAFKRGEKYFVCVNIDDKPHTVTAPVGFGGNVGVEPFGYAVRARL